VPVYKTAKYLALDPELHRKRGRATAFCAAVAAAIVMVVGVIPFRVYVQAGILEPNERRPHGALRRIRAARSCP
jgi:hypothetical protein